MRISRPRVVCGAALLGAVASVSVAVALNRTTSPQPPATSGQPITHEEDFDASLYAEDHGVTQAEAERRISLEDEMWAITRRVADELPEERHAATWMYHEGGFGCVVWFTGKSDPAAEVRIAAIVAEAPAPVEIRWGAKYSYAELRAVHRENAAELWEYEGVLGLGVDALTNTIEVTIAPDSTWAANPDEFAATLEERFGVPFTVEIV